MTYGSGPIDLGLMMIAFDAFAVVVAQRLLLLLMNAFVVSHSLVVVGSEGIDWFDAVVMDRSHFHFHSCSRNASPYRPHGKHRDPLTVVYSRQKDPGAHPSPLPYQSYSPWSLILASGDSHTVHSSSPSSHHCQSDSAVQWLFHSLSPPPHPVSPSG